MQVLNLIVDDFQQDRRKLAVLVRELGGLNLIEVVQINVVVQLVHVLLRVLDTQLLDVVLEPGCSPHVLLSFSGMLHD